MSARWGRAARVAAATAALLAVGALAVVIQAWRAGIQPGDLLGGRPGSGRATAVETAALVATRHAPTIDFLVPKAVGDRPGTDDLPLIANVACADLDRAGLAYVVCPDAPTNRVTLIRLSPACQSTERRRA